MDKELRIFWAVMQALTWVIVGMVLMARLYCVHLNITSGPMYIGWDTVAVVLGGLLGMRLVMWFDPSFRSK